MRTVVRMLQGINIDDGIVSGSILHCSSCVFIKNSSCIKNAVCILLHLILNESEHIDDPLKDNNDTSQHSHLGAQKWSEHLMLHLACACLLNQCLRHTTVPTAVLHGGRRRGRVESQSACQRNHYFAQQDDNKLARGCRCWHWRMTTFDNQIPPLPPLAQPEGIENSCFLLNVKSDKICGIASFLSCLCLLHLLDVLHDFFLSIDTFITWTT